MSECDGASSQKCGISNEAFGLGPLVGAFRLFEDPSALGSAKRLVTGLEDVRVGGQRYGRAVEDGDVVAEGNGMSNFQWLACGRIEAMQRSHRFLKIARYGASDSQSSSISSVCRSLPRIIVSIFPPSFRSRTASIIYSVQCTICPSL